MGLQVNGEDGNWLEFIVIIMSSFEEKYLKALREIEEILKANRQMRDELDVVRTMRQAEIETCTSIQNEEFRKAFDALLRDKNAFAIRSQTLELDNERLKLTVTELEHQLANAQLKLPAEATPKADREAELRRTIENYEEHHATLQRNCRRLEERSSELEGKLQAVEKAWRVKLEAKDLEVVEVKARARQEMSEQVVVLRRENAALRLASSEATVKLENCQQTALFSQQLESLDWEGDLLRQITAVRSSMEPLRQQMTELQETDHYQREQAVRERAGLQARVLELQADGQRQAEVIATLEQRLLQGQEVRNESSGLREQLKRLQQEKQLLNGRIIVMESREVALRTRTGEQLEERVLQFQSRIDLLLSNKEGLRELREVGIHQLIALKAYILELDSRLKELMLSNGYLLKKYKSYKEKYQGSLREVKQAGLTLNTLKMKILGYDQLVQKLQDELEAALRTEPSREPVLADSNQEDLYRRKYVLLQEKLEVQEKYKAQEMETFKLNYETKIMELSIRVEEAKSLRETIELYRTKNQELQAALAKREGESADSKILTQSKITNEPQLHRLSKDMIAGLHATIKSHDETIFRLQSELRTREEAHRRALRKLEKELQDARDTHIRDITRKELDFSLTLDQETKKYKLKVAELEHSQQYPVPTHQGEEGEGKLRSLESRLQAAESARDEQMFSRRRIEKQLLDVTHDHDELQRANSELELKLSHFRARQQGYDGAVGRQETSAGHWEYQLQSKDAIIKKLNIQLREARESQTSKSPAPSQKNDLYYLQKEIQELKDTVARQTRQNNALKNTLEASRAKLSSNLEAVLDEKEALIVRLRRELTLKQNKVLQFQQQAGKLSEQIRRFKRELSQIDRLKQEKARLQAFILEKDRTIQQLRTDESSFDVELDRLRQELTFVKDNYQRLAYESLEKGDQISRLTLQISAAKGNTQIETHLSEQLAERQRQYDRLSSECAAIKNTLRSAEEDRIFHQENYRRASTDILSLRQQISELREENGDLRLQLSSALQETAQVRAALERERDSRASDHEREEEDYLIKTEFFTLKSDISNLKDQLFVKESAITRLSKEISHLQTRNAELEEQVFAYNRLTYEYNTLKEQYTVSVSAVEERDDSIQRLNMELSTHWRKQRELEGQLEYMNTNFIAITRQLDKNRTNLAYFQDEIDAKTRQCLKLTNEVYNLKEEVTNLNEMLNEKQVEIGRVRQELITTRFEASEREYEEKLRIDREIYTLKARTTSLQNDLDDKEEEIRRLQQKARYRPESPTIDIEAQEELRLELERTQRQLLNIKSQNEEYRHQYESLTQTVSTLRKQAANDEQALRIERETLNMEREAFQKWKIQVQAKQVRDQQEFQRLHVEIRQYQDRISSTSHLQRQLSGQTMEIKAKNEQVIILRQNLEQKVQQMMHWQREVGFYKDQLGNAQVKFDQLAKSIQQGLIRHYEPIIRQLQANCRSLEAQVKHQQQLMQEYESQIHEYQQRIFHLSQQSQQYIRAQRNYEASMQQIHIRHSKEISQLRSQLKEQSTVSFPPIPHSHYSPSVVPSTLAIGVSADPEDHSMLVHPYLQQIDRLNFIIRQLEEDLAGFKSKLFSMINHENRIEQNLSNMVRLFNDVISVRQRIQVREAEIGEVRRSFVQKADSSGRSSRALESSGHQLVSSRKLEGRSSLQGSHVQEGQMRGGPVSIKMTGSSHYESTMHAPSHSPLPLPPPQQSLMQPVQTLRIIQQSPILSPQGQLGGIVNVRPANYFIPGATSSETQTGKRH